MMEEALQHFASLQLMGMEPNLLTYNSLLHGYCMVPDMKQCMKLFDEMRDKGVEPSQVTYNTIIQGLFNVGYWESAMNMLVTMELAGLEKDKATYKIIVKGLCENNLFNKALSLFRSLNELEWILDIEFYNILIFGAGMFKPVHFSLALYGELVVKGLQPDICTFNSMIMGLCRHGLLGEALYWLKCIESLGSSGNYVTFNLLVQTMLRDRQLNSLLDILKKMAEHGFKLNPTSANMVRFDPKVKHDVEVCKMLHPFMPNDDYSKIEKAMSGMEETVAEKQTRISDLGSGKGSGYNSIVPHAPGAESHHMTKAMGEKVGDYVDQYVEAREQLKLEQAYKILINLAGEGNAYLQETQFWKLYKEDLPSCSIVMRTSVGVVYLLACLLQFHKPSVSREVAKQLNLTLPLSISDGKAKGVIAKAKTPWEIVPAGHRIGTPAPLFKELINEADCADWFVKEEVEIKATVEPK